MENMLSPSPRFMSAVWQVADMHGWDKDKTERDIAKMLGIAKFTINVADWAECKEAFGLLREMGKI